MEIFSDYLRNAHSDRIFSKTLIGPEESLLDRLQGGGLLQPARTSLHPLHFLPVIGTCVYLSKRHIVPTGHIGTSTLNGKPFFHPPGSYFFPNPLQKFRGIVAARANCIKHGHIVVQQIHEHEIGIISDEKRTLRLLLPGTHVLNQNELTFVGIIDMNLNRTQSYANVKYFYIEQGHVGLTQKGPSIQQYKPGPHISFDPIETLPTEIKILPQTLRLNSVTLNTAEQLRVTLRPVVRTSILSAMNFCSCVCVAMTDSKHLTSYHSSLLTHIYIYIYSDSSRLHTGVPHGVRPGEVSTSPAQR